MNICQLFKHINICKNLGELKPTQIPSTYSMNTFSNEFANMWYLSSLIKRSANYCTFSIMKLYSLLWDDRQSQLYYTVYLSSVGD